MYQAAVKKAEEGSDVLSVIEDEKSDHEVISNKWVINHLRPVVGDLLPLPGDPPDLPVDDLSTQLNITLTYRTWIAF